MVVKADVSRTQKAMRRNRLTWLIVVGAFGCALGALAVLHPTGRFFLALAGFPDVEEWLLRKSFNSATWKDPDSVAKEQIRIRMVDDLLVNHDLVGMQRSDVVALLGEPKQASYFKEYDLVYWLGDERTVVGIDSEWLCIKLTADGRVSSRVVLTD